MSRAVTLRWNEHPVEGRVAIQGGVAALDLEGGRRIEATITREGAWIEVAIGGRRVRAATARDARAVWVSVEGRVYRFEIAPRHRHADAHGGAESPGEVLAPMTGRVASVAAREGAAVREGDLLLTIEAMKMEFKVVAPRSGAVREVACAAGDRVELNQVLARIESEEGGS